MQRNLGKDEGEFANLGKPYADSPRCFPAVAKQTYDQKPNHEFAYKDQPDHHRKKPPTGQPSERINQHANGDEEERYEHISNGKSLGSKFMGVGGAAE